MKEIAEEENKRLRRHEISDQKPAVEKGVGGKNDISPLTITPFHM
jgi:hypothetical protein